MKKILEFIKSIFKYITSFIKTLFTFIFNLIFSFIKEIYVTLKYAGIGIFKIIEFIFISIGKLITYIYHAIKFIGKWIGKIIYYMCIYFYKYIIKYILTEIYILLKLALLGAIKVLKILFYEFPKLIIKSCRVFFSLIYKKTKLIVIKIKEKLSLFTEGIRKRINLFTERIGYFFKHTPNKIKEYFVNKWSNLSIVKHYRNKKERELEVLLIDKFGKDAEKTDKKLTYEYLARNAEGKLIKGYFAALSKLDVHSYLLDAGFEVYEIKTNWWINLVHGESRYLERPMKNKDLMFWLAQLSTYLKAGIPLTDAVKVLADQDKRKKYVKVYDSVIYELSMGESFSEALRKQGNVFPPLLVNMIKAAELIGDLESTLDDMSDYYEQKEITRKQMLSALTYPAIILIFAIVVISFMFIYIVPEFEGIYEGLGAEITGMTAFLLNTSNFMQNNIIKMLIGLIAILILYRILYRRSKPFRTFMQYIYMHIPVVGKLLIYNEMTLFAKTFAVLNKNNILLTDSIDILSKITTNEFYKMIMYDTISNLLRGENMSLSFKDNWAVPKLAYHMITTGESTGELSEMLEKVSEHYQREQRSLANTLKSLVEPILMIFLAVVVGTIMISVLVPMYSISSEVIK